MRLKSHNKVFLGRVSEVLFNAFPGTDNTRSAFLLELIVLVFYTGYAYYTAIVLGTSVEIVWYSEFVYWGLLGILSYWCLRKGNWQKKEI